MKFQANVLPIVMVMMALEPNGFVAAKGLSIRVIAKVEFPLNASPHFARDSPCGIRQ